MDIDEKVAFLELAYQRFNERDVDALLAMLTDDVEWPDIARGAVLRGPREIRPYWEAQFEAADPRVTPTAFIPTGDEMVAVVDQRVFDNDGRPITAATVVYHRYAFRDDLVCRMRVFADRNESVMAR